MALSSDLLSRHICVMYFLVVAGAVDLVVHEMNRNNAFTDD